MTQKMFSLGDSFLKCINTGVDHWIYASGTRTAQQLNEWCLKDEARLKKTYINIGQKST